MLTLYIFIKFIHVIAFVRQFYIWKCCLNNKTLMFQNRQFYIWKCCLNNKTLMFQNRQLTPMISWNTLTMNSWTNARYGNQTTSKFILFYFIRVLNNWLKIIFHNVQPRVYHFKRTFSFWPKHYYHNNMNTFLTHLLLGLHFLFSPFKY